MYPVRSFTSHTVKYLRIGFSLNFPGLTIENLQGYSLQAEWIMINLAIMEKTDHFNLTVLIDIVNGNRAWTIRCSPRGTG